VFASATLLPVFCQLCLAADPPPSSPTPPPSGALQAIESERGGRHWVDAKTDPPKSPTESLATFQIEQGYRIELVAAEPLVKDPVAITFDDRGRMYVMEFSDYPIGPPEGKDPLSKIVMLEDTDGDGILDRRHLFADKLDFANSIMAYKDGLLVGAQSKILYVQDTDGDHIADVRQTLFDGFQPAHSQMQICNPRWGIDNWIYLNYGAGKVASSRDPEHPIALPRKDFRFHPRTMEFGSDSGLGQYGNTIDRWGNRFYCLNRNPIITTFLSPSVMARNPYHIVAKPFYDVGKAGGATRVYPLLEMKSNYLSHAGTHTSACGTTAYLGEFGEPNLASSVFVCEPIGHLVTRSIVEPDGLHLKARRAQPKRDFLASTDSWFRPSSLANGPDGALYLADMYRLWVEHPNFLPPEISAKLDWRAGDDRGRIYRIVPTAAKPRSFDRPESVEDSVALLTDPNGWRQFLGQRLLVEKQSKEASPLIRRLLSDTHPTTRLHALWTLDGLSSLQPSDVVSSMEDKETRVRVAAIKLGRKWLDSPTVFRAMADLADDSEVRVRFQVALALSANESQEATELLGRLALRDGHDRSFADGLLTSTKNRSGAILATLLDSEDFVTDDDANRIDFVKQLASVVGARGDSTELIDLLKLLSPVESDSPERPERWRMAAISGLGQGLPRYHGELGRLTLASLIAKPPATLAGSIGSLKLGLDQYPKTALDSSREVSDRVAAIELLTFLPLRDTGPAFSELLSNLQPVEVQTAAVNALAKNRSAAAAKIVLKKWSQLRPILRSTALGLLLRRTDSTRMMLDSMADEIIHRSALSIDQRVRLLKHADPEIRQQATDLFGGAVSANRSKVAEEYKSALSLKGSFTDGKEVFSRVCAACHRRDGVGHEAGPDLSDVRNRSKAALLYDILDPNAKVEPRFIASSILTIDGSVFQGLIASETSDAIVLTMAEGKQQTIGRAEIERMKVSDVSLMPEGIEKDVTVQQMADLLEYLAGVQ